MRKAFTLAEIMIVLTVIGVLGAVLLPTAFHARPDENLIKFKNANTTFINVIRELINSGEYYTVNDLGRLANGKLVTTLNTDEGSLDAEKHFCQTLGKVLKLNSSKINCKTEGYSKLYATVAKEEMGAYVNDIDTLKSNLDKYCALAQQNDASFGTTAELLLSDGVVWYQASPQATFATVDDSGKRIFSNPESSANYPDASGRDANYKVFCIDVDGFDAAADEDTTQPPFGYGVRADGKVVSGALADSWLEKNAQSVTGTNNSSSDTSN